MNNLTPEDQVQEDVETERRSHFHQGHQRFLDSIHLERRLEGVTETLHPEMVPQMSTEGLIRFTHPEKLQSASQTVKNAVVGSCLTPKYLSDQKQADIGEETDQPQQGLQEEEASGREPLQ